MSGRETEAQMTHEILRRIDKLESTVESLRATDSRIDKTLSELNTTLALLNQTVDSMSVREEQRRTLVNKIVMFIIGGFVAAFIAWIVNGGLAL